MLYPHYETAGRHIAAAQALISEARSVVDPDQWVRLLNAASLEAAEAERLIDQTIILAEAV